ncbi:winged helix-turn-helix transcriptional regulator [Candidatus Nitrososphaera sp. FF02]|uniref:winged helix-turn-helix transcriptional regulator n=1 Tax=Candidatus Nitrososphaera sp. FF02 TaxID=3398226 RepID=UPI0039E7B96A
MPEIEALAVMQHMKQCPINFTFQIIGKKFTVLILRNMMHMGHRHFNEFLTIEGINPKTLSQRLKEMQKNGLIDRRVTPGTPVTIEYYLTDTGRELKTILDSLMEFSMQHFAGQVCKDGMPHTIDELVKKPAN